MYQHGCVVQISRVRRMHVEEHCWG